jgi:hypothetical protein
MKKIHGTYDMKNTYDMKKSMGHMTWKKSMGHTYDMKKIHGTYDMKKIHVTYDMNCLCDVREYTWPEALNKIPCNLLKTCHYKDSIWQPWRWLTWTTDEQNLLKTSLLTSG